MITLFSTNCPKCKVLTMKLDKKGINYTKVEDVDVMLAKGIKTAPYLEVDNELMDFTQAVAWVNAQ
nr:MAG TPA: Thioredoxin reductase 3 [Caudoviricetes sp.]